MRIHSAEIPQADVLSDVVHVVEAVQSGAKTFQDIAYYIDKVERQGRYYRLAAEILGFIKNERNYAKLTPFGKKFVESSPKEKDSLLLAAVLNASLFQRMLPFLELHPEGVTRTQLEKFINEVTQPVGSTMVPRRVSTVISWLEALRVIRHDDSRYKLIKIPKSVPLLEFKETEPLMPKTGELKEYITVQERAKTAKSSVKIMRNQAAMERANHAHRRLVNLVAERIRHVGILPRCNQLIDLAARINDRPFIFEMKSITARNAHTQLRTGISQLFEYRYLQNLPEAILALVIEKPLPRQDFWMRDYLESDLNIRLLWDGYNRLYASYETRKDLTFLWST